MSIRRELIRTAVALVALALGSGPSRADGGPAGAITDAQALVREGRFGEAYDRVAGGSTEPDPAALAALARAILVRAIGSGDAFERWAGMRAARAIADPAFAEPARAQLHSGGRYEEALALEILATSDPRGSRNDFIAALDSPYRVIRIRALRALAPEADAGLIPRLMLVVTEDGDPDMRVLAIRTLRAWKASEATPALRHAMDDPAPAVQQEAVKALVGFEDGEVVAILRRKLAGAPPEQRPAALRLVALAPRRELLPDVARFLADGDPETRAAAARTMLTMHAGAGG